jgi:glycosyltransferase involved in cell wall biosynthesis
MALAVSVSPVRVAHVATVDLTLRFLLLDQMVRLRSEGFEVTAISAPGPWTADLEAQGIRFVPWRHVTRAWDPVADGRAFMELHRIFRAGSFDLVHTHTPKPGILGRVAARLAGVPCVLNTVHGLYATPDDPLTKRLAVSAVEWLAAWFSDLELFQSEEDLHWARRNGLVREARSILLGNGTDVRRLDPSAIPSSGTSALRRELSIPAGAPVIGMIGRMVVEKGWREFFAAARAVRDVLPEVRFLAVGSPDREKWDAIRDEDLSSAGANVIFTGWREDVQDLLALMDVFVLPSWREGLPRSAIEAAAMGKALVLTDIRGCREVADDGKEALFVPPRDPQRLTAAILRLLLDPGLRVRLGRAARRKALERFDERRVEDIILAAYRKVLLEKRLVTGEEPLRRRTGGPATEQASSFVVLPESLPRDARTSR